MASLQVYSCTRGSVAVVRPQGQLDLSTHIDLRDKLLKTAADNPAAIVVDLDHLVIGTDAMLTGFAVVAGRIGDWPGIPLLVVATAPAQLALLRSASVRNVVPIHDSLPSALRACDALVPYRYRRIHLPPATLSVVRARMFTTDVALAWNLPDALDDLNTIVVALVTNVVVHARTQMWIRITEQREMVRVSVRDQCPQPVGHVAGGLRSVDRLAKMWGSMPTADRGKVMWALLDTRAR